MKNIFRLLLTFWLGLFAWASASAQVNVWTHRYDNARTGANLAETLLNTSNVNSSQFGKLFSYAVDADIYTQPLVINNVSIPGKGTHNVVYVATNNNSVYAFDANNNQGANSQPLWQVNFNVPGVTPLPASDVGTGDNIRTPGVIGIMGTPVIDQTTGTMYLVARTKEAPGGNTSYLQRLHALDITTGAEKFGGPVVIQAAVPGSGYDNVGGVVTFNPLQENQRAGIALANGNVYIAWASYGDTDPWHGWVMAYSASTLQQVGVLCITPNGAEGGIWQSGQPLSVDGSGNLYTATGNGDFDGVANFGMSILKLSPTLSVIDWFTPDNWAGLNALDLDLSSAGVLLVPGSTDAIGTGKDGNLYVVNQNGLGHTQAGNGQIVQLLPVSVDEIHGSPTYWNGPSGPWAYVWGAEDYLKAFAFNGSKLVTTPISESTYPAPSGLPGGFLTISANGSQAGSGILWVSMPYAEDADVEIVSGVLRAFDASNLTHELWNTRMVPGRDDLGNFAKFVPPTVANGFVYVPSFSNLLHVYGLLGSIPPVTGGSLTGSGVASTAMVNLTVGTADWAAWPGYDGKASGNGQISDFALLGSVATATTYGNDPRTLSWNDGTVTVCNLTSAGVSVSGTSNGFLITAPADTTSRTLLLYVGGSNSAGMLTAQLSDGSAPDFVDTSFSSTGQYDVVYTLNYHAASANQQLTAVWTLFSGAGNVTLQAAALAGGSSQTPAGCGVWVEDAVPAGASQQGNGEGWEWVTEYPTPYSGMLAHESALAAGLHQHFFLNATATLAVGASDSLFCYVYLDPANPPSEVMLQWNNGSWEHRAYWGQDLIGWGTDGTASRQYMGALPAAGQWIQLAVPAAQVGLGGSTLNGMAYTLYGGRATWDYAGTMTPTYQVSGTVTLNGAALSGVNFAATAGVNCTASGGTGVYACTVPQGWSGTVTPSLTGYSFTPPSLSYSNVVTNQSAQNYAATVNTTTTLVSSLNPSLVGANVTFTATVTGSAPTGSVGFTANSTPLSGCTAVALPSGSANSKTATCSTASLAAGTYSIVAVYSGDGANTGSTSPTLSQVVNSVASGALVNPSFEIPALGSGYQYNPSAPGIGWTFNGSGIQGNGSAFNAAPAPNGTQTAFIQRTSSISQTLSLAAGSYTLSFQAAQRACCSSPYVNPVQVTVDGTQIGSLASPASTSFSSFSIPFSVATTGAHSITFTGTNSNDDTTFIDAVALAPSGLAPTTTTLASSVNPSTVGANVTFTATVTGSAPTGSVGFTANGAPLSGCGAVALPSGSANSKTATCSTASLAAGTYSIVAAYSGDSANTGSTSATLSQVVNNSMTASTTSLASSANPSLVGANVTFTATVTGSAPTGSVGFTANSTPLSGCTAVALPSGSANSKTATCSTASLAAGTYSIVAVYSGDGANTGSTSPTLSQVVNSVASGALVNPSFEIPALGSGYQYNPSAPGIGWTFNGSGIQGNGSAFNAAPAPNGTQTAFIQRTSSISQTLSLAAGSYTLSFQAAQRACCSSPYVNPVQVTVDGTQIGSLASPASTSFSSFSIPFSVATTGAHSITFTGTNSNDDTTFIDAVALAPSGLAPTTTTLASSVNPSTVGANVTFTATVTGSAPTGSVGFTANGAPLSGCGAVALPSGSANSKTATCSTASLAAGTYSIVAAYSGDSANTGSTSATLSQVVNNSMTASTTSLASSANPSLVGANVTFTATVTGSAPTGSVGFTANSTPLSGCTAVALPSGSANSKTATCSTASLAAGTYSIVAVYSGDGANTGSTSPTLSQVVNSVASGALVNPSFEIPALGSGYQYNPSAPGIGWTFNGSGIQGNGSAFNAAPAPNGTQTAFIQRTSSISQTLSLAAGSYTLSFQAAQRVCCDLPFMQPVQVTVDGTAVGSLVSPTSTSFSSFSIPFSVATTGAHTITFTGTNPNDDTTFIDAVTLQ